MKHEFLGVARSQVPRSSLTGGMIFVGSDAEQSPRVSIRLLLRLSCSLRWGMLEVGTALSMDGLLQLKLRNIFKHASVNMLIPDHSRHHCGDTKWVALVLILCTIFISIVHYSLKNYLAFFVVCLGPSVRRNAKLILRKRRCLATISAKFKIVAVMTHSLNVGGDMVKDNNRVYFLIPVLVCGQSVQLFVLRRKSSHP